MGRQTPLSATALLAAALATATTLAQPDERKDSRAREGAERRHFDARIEVTASLAPVAPLDTQRAEVNSLRALLPDLRAEFDPFTGATRSLWNVGGLLTPADRRVPREIAQDFMASHATLLGLTAADVADAELTDSVYSPNSGVTHLYFRQRLGGIPVYNAQLHVNITRDGRVLSLNNSFLPDLAAAVPSLRPAIDARDAVGRAGEQLGLRTPALVVTRPAAGLRHETELAAPGLSKEAVRAELMILPVRKGDARLVWNFQIWTPNGQHAFDFTVDAASAAVWTRIDWVAADRYRVYPRAVESPAHTAPLPPGDARALVADPADDTASPFGWHDIDGVAGAEFTTTDGNNVSAYADADADDLPDREGSPECGTLLDCDFALDLSRPPSAYRPAVVANLFYWNNLLHDVQHRYGFDEAAGNFQANNYGRGGLGGDSVQAEAQDGGGTDNANFATPPDGWPPRMQMYTWTATTPGRDSDLDAGVIVHEYGHGVSNRLVGGPASVSCLGNAQQPGEGISDWLALVYTARASHTAAQPRGIGTYLLGQPATGTGIRPRPYTTDNAVNDWTYASIASDLSIPHGVGAVWAQAMWEVYWALVNHYGFSDDLHDATGGAGNQRALLYHTEGMKFAACSPGFTQMRDGILQAAQAINGMGDACRLWRAFAGFGLGANAVNPSPHSVSNVAGGFEVPAACGSAASPGLSIDDASAIEGPSGAATATFVVSLSAPSSAEVRVTYSVADGTATAPEDYVRTNGDLVFPPGAVRRSIPVAVNGDPHTEPDETFVVRLSNPVNATLIDAQGTGTVINDDGLQASVPPATTNDSYATPFGSDLTVAAPGVLANDRHEGSGALMAELVAGPSRGRVVLSASGAFWYVPNGGFVHTDRFTYRAVSGEGPGNVATVTVLVGAGLPATAPDAYSTPYAGTLTITSPGVLANDRGDGPLVAELVQGAGHGTLALGADGAVSYTPDAGFAGTDSFAYRAVSAAGTGSVAMVTIAVAEPTTLQPPFNLRVDSVAGHTVTLRWDTLPLGPRASDFIVEGGLRPGEVLVSLPTGSAAPIYSFVAPAGSFFIRVYGRSGSDRSPASNEVPLHVNVPVQPSSPAGLLGLVHGDALELAWRNTFEGGPATGLVLDVSGSLDASLPLEVGERFRFAPVPGGTYTFSLRAVNAGGASPPSNAVTLSFPAACSGPPFAPAGFLAHRVGNSVTAVWDPPPAGPAPSGYVLNVSGAHSGQVPTTGRALSGSVRPGAYALSVAAVNACGQGAATAVQIVAVP